MADLLCFLDVALIQFPTMFSPPGGKNIFSFFPVFFRQSCVANVFSWPNIFLQCFPPLDGKYIFFLFLSSFVPILCGKVHKKTCITQTLFGIRVHKKNETGQPYFAYLLAPRGIEDRFLAFAFFGVADLDHMSFIAPKK